VLASEGGVGKSLLTLHLGLSLALNRTTNLRATNSTGTADKDSLLPKAQSGKVVLLYGEEDHASCAYRLKQLLSSPDGQIPPKATLEALSGRLIPWPLLASRTDLDSNLKLSGSTHDKEQILDAKQRFGDLCESLTKLDEQTKDKGRGFDLIVVDPLAQFGGGDFEVSNGEASSLMEQFQKLTLLEGNPTVLLVHHSPKASKRSSNKIRGSSAIKDNSRWAGLLRRIGEDESGESFLRDKQGRTVIEFAIVKQNYGPDYLKVRCLIHKAQLIQITDDYLLSANKSDNPKSKTKAENSNIMDSALSTAAPIRDARRSR